MWAFLNTKHKVIFLCLIVVGFSREIGYEYDSGFSIGFGVGESFLGPGTYFSTSFTEEFSVRYNFKKISSKWDARIRYGLSLSHHKLYQSRTFKINNWRLDLIYTPKKWQVCPYYYGGLGINQMNWSSFSNEDEVGGDIIFDSQRQKSIGFGAGLIFNLNSNVAFLANIDADYCQIEIPTSYLLFVNGYQEEDPRLHYKFDKFLKTTFLISVFYRY